MKRYNEYKDSGISWIGEIPAGWNTRKGKSFLNLITRASDNPNKIGLENIESFTGKFIGTCSDFSGNGTDVHEGDIVYGKLRPYLCKAWLATFNCNAVGDFFVFRCDESISKEYIHFLFLSDTFTTVCNSSTYGAKMPRVASDFILSLKFPLPSTQEQHAIANFLDEKCGEIDELVALQEQMITELQAYKQSVITEAVTHGLNHDAKMKDSGVEWIGEIPEHWNICKIKTFFPWSQVLRPKIFYP